MKDLYRNEPETLLEQSNNYEMIDLDEDDHQIDQANSCDNDIKSQSKSQNDQA